MSLRSRIEWSVILAITCVGWTSAARAGLVTPDSVPSTFSTEADGSAPSGVLITNQYQDLGFLFPTQGQSGSGPVYNTTIIRLWNGIDLFTGAYQTTTLSGVVNHVSYQSPAGVTAAFVLPGTTTPDVVDSATVSLYSNGPILAQAEAFDKNGQLLKTITRQVASEIDTPIEFDIADIQSVYVTAFKPMIGPPLPGEASVQGKPDFIWGVSSIERHEAPEPAGFVLGALGMFALTGYALRRRLIHAHLGVRGA